MQILWTKVIKCDIPWYNITYYSSCYKTYELQYMKKFYVKISLTQNLYAIHNNSLIGFSRSVYKYGFYAGNKKAFL
jgi:hypothetical protein